MWLSRQAITRRRDNKSVFKLFQFLHEHLNVALHFERRGAWVLILLPSHPFPPCAQALFKWAVEKTVPAIPLLPLLFTGSFNMSGLLLLLLRRGERCFPSSISSFSLHAFYAQLSGNCLFGLCCSRRKGVGFLSAAKPRPWNCQRCCCCCCCCYDHFHFRFFFEIEKYL